MDIERTACGCTCTGALTTLCTKHIQADDLAKRLEQRSQVAFCSILRHLHPIRQASSRVACAGMCAARCATVRWTHQEHMAWRGGADAAAEPVTAASFVCILLTWPTNSFRGAMAGSGGSPGRIRFGLAKDTTSGLLPFNRVRPL
jgi:hypothetical protein